MISSQALRKIIRIALLLAVFPVIAGYIYPVSHILEEMAKERLKLRSAVLGVHTFLSAAGKRTDLRETLTLERAGKWRLESEGVVEVSDGNTSARIEKGKVVASGARTLNFAASLFVDYRRGKNARSAIVEALRRVGVDFDVVSLARQDGLPCYVIGAKPWERDKPQLWVYKSGFQPARLILPADGDQPAFELRMHDYATPPTGSRYPARTEELRGGTVVRESIVESAEFNVSLPDDTFQIPS